MTNALALCGLSLTLVGACLLFFYGMPRKRIGNVIMSGDTALKFDGGGRDVPESEWQPIFTSFRRRAKVLNSTGFALVAVGTLLQMLALI